MPNISFSLSGHKFDPSSSLHPVEGYRVPLNGIFGLGASLQTEVTQELEDQNLQGIIIKTHGHETHDS